MNIYVLDGLNGIIGIVDTFKSLIWNVQYFGISDFQLVLGASNEMMNLLQIGRYLVREEDVKSNGFDNVMIINKYQLDFDTETGWLLTISGSGLKNLVSQRVVWNQTSLVGNAEMGIRQVIEDNIINPKNIERKFDNFKLDEVQGFSETIETQLFGENLANWLVEICTTYGFGWDIYIRDGCYVFKLYKGVNRTYNQDDVPPVVFSPEYDNLLSSSYSFSRQGYRNAALIGGEGEGASKTTAQVGLETTGFERFETYVDGSSVSSNGEIITLEQYNKMLKEYGQNQIDQTAYTRTFSGEIEPVGMYTINKDFFLGDIVQIENDKGIKATPRIIEIIYAEDESGASTVPTFSEWEVS